MVEAVVYLRAKDYLSGAIDHSADRVHKLEQEFVGMSNKADNRLNKVAHDFDLVTKKADKLGDELSSIGKGGANHADLMPPPDNAGGGLTSLLGEMPGISNAAGLLANPYAAAGAAVLALGTGVVKLGQHLNELSIEFDHNRRQVQLFFGAMNTPLEIDALTAQSGALAKEFNRDAEEINTTANVMAKEFGISASEAFTNVQKSLQATNGMMDLAQLREYSTQLREAGLTAEDMAAITAEATKNGIYDDKALDAIKEAGLRLREQTQPVQDMVDKYGKALGLQKDFMSGIKTGSLDVISAVQQISVGLDKVDNKARQEIITNIFGGAGEDAGQQFFKMMAQGVPTFDKLINTSDKFIIRQNKRLELETKINKQIAAIAPTMNEVSGEWDLLILKGKVFFYETVKKGFDWWNDFVEGPTFQKLSNWFDEVTDKASAFFNQFIEQSEIFGSSLVRQLDPFFESLNEVDTMMQRIFGEHYISEFFQKELDGIIDAFKMLNKLMLSVEAISNPSKDKGIIGDMIDIWKEKKKTATSNIGSNEYGKQFGSDGAAAYYNERDNRTGDYAGKPFSRKSTSTGLTAAEKKTADKSVSGVVSGNGGVRNIIVNLNVHNAYNVSASGVNDMKDLKIVADNSSKIVMDSLTQEIRNYEDIL